MKNLRNKDGMAALDSR